MPARVSIPRIRPVARATALATLMSATTVGQIAADALDTHLRTGRPPADSAQEEPSSPRRPTAPRTARAALERARKLVPGLNASELVLIDPELAAEPAAVRRLDAFTVSEDDGQMRQKVYINLESEIMRRAAGGDDFYVGVLAAVIVHELEHLNGGDETAARRAERHFIEELVARGRLDRGKGQQYLAFLRGQWDDRR